MTLDIHTASPAALLPAVDLHLDPLDTGLADTVYGPNEWLSVEQIRQALVGQYADKGSDKQWQAFGLFYTVGQGISKPIFAKALASGVVGVDDSGAIAFDLGRDIHSLCRVAVDLGQQSDDGWSLDPEVLRRGLEAMDFHVDLSDDAFHDIAQAAMAPLAGQPGWGAARAPFDDESLVAVGNHITTTGHRDTVLSLLDDTGHVATADLAQRVQAAGFILQGDAAWQLPLVAAAYDADGDGALGYVELSALILDTTLSLDTFDRSAAISFSTPAARQALVAAFFAGADGGAGRLDAAGFQAAAAAIGFSLDEASAAFGLVASAHGDGTSVDAQGLLAAFEEGTLDVDPRVLDDGRTAAALVFQAQGDAARTALVDALFAGAGDASLTGSQLLAGLQAAGLNPGQGEQALQDADAFVAFYSEALDGLTRSDVHALLASGALDVDGTTVSLHVSGEMAQSSELQDTGPGERMRGRVLQMLRGITLPDDFIDDENYVVAIEGLFPSLVDSVALTAAQVQLVIQAYSSGQPPVNLSKADLYAAFKDGALTIDDAGTLGLRLTDRLMPVLGHEVFARGNTDADGFIDPAELKRGLAAFGLDIAQPDAQLLVQALAPKQRGAISEAELLGALADGCIGGVPGSATLNWRTELTAKALMNLGVDKASDTVVWKDALVRGLKQLGYTTVNISDTQFYRLSRVYGGASGAVKFTQDQLLRMLQDHAIDLRGSTASYQLTPAQYQDFADRLYTRLTGLNGMLNDLDLQRALEKEGLQVDVPDDVLARLVTEFDSEQTLSFARLTTTELKALLDGGGLQIVGNKVTAGTTDGETAAQAVFQHFGRSLQQQDSNTITADELLGFLRQQGAFSDGAFGDAQLPVLRRVVDAITGRSDGTLTLGDLATLLDQSVFTLGEQGGTIGLNAANENVGKAMAAELVAVAPAGALDYQAFTARLTALGFDPVLQHVSQAQYELLCADGGAAAGSTSAATPGTANEAMLARAIRMGALRFDAGEVSFTVAPEMSATVGRLLPTANLQRGPIHDLTDAFAAIGFRCDTPTATFLFRLLSASNGEAVDRARIQALVADGSLVLDDGEVRIVGTPALAGLVADKAFAGQAEQTGTDLLGNLESLGLAVDMQPAELAVAIGDSRVLTKDTFVQALAKGWLQWNGLAIEGGSGRIEGGNGPLVQAREVFEAAWSPDAASLEWRDLRIEFDNRPLAQAVFDAYAGDDRRISEPELARMLADGAIELSPDDSTASLWVATVSFGAAASQQALRNALAAAGQQGGDYHDALAAVLFNTLGINLHLSAEQWALVERTYGGQGKTAADVALAAYEDGALLATSTAVDLGMTERLAGALAQELVTAAPPDDGKVLHRTLGAVLQRHGIELATEGSAHELLWGLYDGAGQASEWELAQLLHYNLQLGATGQATLVAGLDATRRLASALGSVDSAGELGEQLGRFGLDVRLSDSEAQAAFGAADVDHSGELSESELQQAFDGGPLRIDGNAVRLAMTHRAAVEVAGQIAAHAGDDGRVTPEELNAALGAKGYGALTQEQLAQLATAYSVTDPAAAQWGLNELARMLGEKVLVLDGASHQARVEANPAQQSPLAPYQVQAIFGLTQARLREAAAQAAQGTSLKALADALDTLQAERDLPQPDAARMARLQARIAALTALPEVRAAYGAAVNQAVEETVGDAWASGLAQRISSYLLAPGMTGYLDSLEPSARLQFVEQWMPLLFALDKQAATQVVAALGADESSRADASLDARLKDPAAWDDYVAMLRGLKQDVAALGKETDGPTDAQMGVDAFRLLRTATLGGVLGLASTYTLSAGPRTGIVAANAGKGAFVTNFNNQFREGVLAAEVGFIQSTVQPYYRSWHYTEAFATSSWGRRARGAGHVAKWLATTGLLDGFAAAMRLVNVLQDRAAGDYSGKPATIAADVLQGSVDLTRAALKGTEYLKGWEATNFLRSNVADAWQRLRHPTANSAWSALYGAQFTVGSIVRAAATSASVLGAVASYDRMTNATLNGYQRVGAGLQFAGNSLDAVFTACGYLPWPAVKAWCDLLDGAALLTVVAGSAVDWYGTSVAVEEKRQELAAKQAALAGTTTLGSGSESTA